MTPYAQQLDQLIDGTLDAGGFSHSDHVGVAYEALNRMDFFTAVATVANGISAAAQRAGAMDKFNATITMAYMSEIAERMVATNYEDGDHFIAANPDLLTDAVVSRFSKGRATSALARRIALLPDLPRAS